MKMCPNSSFGVCCLFIIQDASTMVSQNCSYIQNENFPMALQALNAVQFTVQRCSNGELFCLYRIGPNTFDPF